MQIPKQGLTREEILATLQAFKGRDMDWKTGRVWCYVYNPGEDPAEVTREAYLSFLTENGLDPTVFPSMLKLETEVVRAVIHLLRGDSNAVGHLTTGGTESIMLAVKTARDKARAEHPGITRPEMVLPKTAHAAFHKAAHYLSVKPVIVDIDPRTFKVHAEDMRRAITPTPFSWSHLRRIIHRASSTRLGRSVKSRREKTCSSMWMAVWEGCISPLCANWDTTSQTSISRCRASRPFPQTCTNTDMRQRVAP